jgi:hypothetical protein
MTGVVSTPRVRAFATAGLAAERQVQRWERHNAAGQAHRVALHDNALEPGRHVAHGDGQAPGKG